MTASTITIPPPRSAAHHLERVAVDIAGAAADLVRGSVGAGSIRGTKSTETDVVTHTDIESERLIRHEILERCPGSSVLGEELDDDAGSNSVSWIVDPIDGTVNFLYDLPVVAVSIAASIAGRVVAGAVADVLRNEVFSAAVGTGARRDGAPIAADGDAELGRALVGTGFSYDAARRSEQSAILDRVLPAARDIRCMGSAALNLCWVACGRLDAYYEHDTKPYDYAAGAVIAREAGAVVELPDDNGDGLTVAAPSTSFDEVRRLVTG
ncbi:MAG: inositol monophosphatase family protein [Actinomycetota bacterium]